MMQQLKTQLRQYYDGIRGGRLEKNLDYMARLEAIRSQMEAYVGQRPEASGVMIKAKLHEVIAEAFEPVIFTRSPFFFEMGVRQAESWGVPSHRLAPACWWYYKQEESRLNQMPENDLLWRRFGLHGETDIKLLTACGFDRDHHCLGYTRLLREGFDGVLKRLDERLAQGGLDDKQAEFLEAARRGCRTMIHTAHKFADKAEELLAGNVDEQEREFLGMIAEAGRWVPQYSPRSFYEALAMMWFVREAVASFEGIGISVIGHLDRLLIGYYRADIEAGKLTVEQAKDWLGRWMMPTDVKFHVEDNAWPETSTCMELGGCDESGEVVFNELTRLILEVHYEQGYLNPKLNCRYSASSPQAYLELMSDYTLKGHNQFAFINDDVLIPACMKSGKTVEEARLYVNGGCQETMVEGVEHSAGAFFYFNVARAFNMMLGKRIELSVENEYVRDYFPDSIKEAEHFEQFYERTMEGVRGLLSVTAGWSREVGADWDEVNPCPIFSTTIEGCIEEGRDYSVGSAKYNPSGLALVGFGTLVDSLLAIRQGVFRDGCCSLAELEKVLRANWRGYEALREQLVRYPKYGHGDGEADALAGRVAGDLARMTRELPNERGDWFQPSFFVYYSFVWFGAATTATPDGRYDGQMLSQGIAPGRVRVPGSLTQVLNSVSQVDFTDYAGNAVLDLQLPAVGNLSPLTLAAVLRSFAQLGGPTLQCNFASVDAMRDAQVNPGEHEDLVVRISGLSARFVCLHKDVQDEIIDRMILV